VKTAPPILLMDGSPRRLERHSEFPYSGGDSAGALLEEL
jgi:hypothetical protein